jgi:hypothetical protein
MCSSTRGPASEPARPLRERDEARRRLAHLADAAGRGGEVRAEDRLDRIDRENRRLERFGALDDRRERRLAEHVDLIRREPETIRAHADLLRRLLAGHVEHPRAALAERRGRLQEQRRLADAGVAADQDDGAFDEPAPEHAIELADTGLAPALRVGLDLGEKLRQLVRRDRAEARRGGRDPLLDERLPLPAVGAAPHPLRRLVAAVLAGEERAVAGHGGPIPRAAGRSVNRAFYSG